MRNLIHVANNVFIPIPSLPPALSLLFLMGAAWHHAASINGEGYRVWAAAFTPLPRSISLRDWPKGGTFSLGSSNHANFSLSSEMVHCALCNTPCFKKKMYVQYNLDISLPSNCALIIITIQNHDHLVEEWTFKN